MKIVKLACIVLSLFVIGGCAHSIVMEPNIEKISTEIENKQRIKKNVAYYISDEKRNLEVNSRGGGGDSVNYFPYRDIEVAFEKMLLYVFQKVTKLEIKPDSNRESIKDIDYIIVPTIKTESSSTSSFTWPPTDFTVDLTGTIMDGSWKQIEIIKVIGKGEAQYSEFFSQRGIAGSRAMENALLKMTRAMFAANYDNAASIKKSVPSGLYTETNDTAVERLEKLKVLSDRGLITREEFEQKKREILDGL